MATGYAIHIAVNKVLEGAPGYRGTEIKPLYNCLLDAQFYASLSGSLGYELVAYLEDDWATRQTLESHIRKLAGRMVAGDILLLTFSGHGVFLEGGGPEERTGKNQGWCMADGILVDDQLCEYWTWFPKDVRIAVVSDSCYSGGMLRAAQETAANPNRFPTNQCGNGTLIQATVILLAGCNEAKTAFEGNGMGAFTSCLKTTWKKYYQGRGKAGYRTLAEDIRVISNRQTPCFKTVGAPNPEFESQHPFEIEFTTNL